MAAITIVVPTYNNGEYLRAALDSALGQTFDDFEVLVVDDGSTDKTRELVASYGDRVRYHYQPNQGLAVARNTGLDLAQGDYVTYLDGDDMMLPDNLVCKHRLLERHPELGGVFSDFEVFSDDRTLHASGIKSTFGFFARTRMDYADVFEHRESLPRDGGGVDEFYYGEIFESLFKGNLILPSTMVFRRTYALEVGHFVPHLRTQQDYEYWLRFARRRPFGFVDRVLLRYRRHARQLTDRSNMVRVIETALSIVSSYEQFFIERGHIGAFNSRKAEMLQTLAKAYMSRGRSREARQALAESFRRDPTRVSTGVYYVAALLPLPWLQALYRGAKGQQSA